MMAALASLAEPDQAILAPDGLFPVPITAPGKPLKLGYTWYIFDPSTDRYLVDMKTACAYIDSLVQTLGLANLPVRIIGFSMGAYLAPHVGLTLKHCRHVIGINGRFRSEVLKDPLPFVIDGIHGADDQMVDPQRAAERHAGLLACGSKGRFTLVEHEGHRLSGRMLVAAQKRVHKYALNI